MQAEQTREAEASRRVAEERLLVFHFIAEPLKALAQMRAAVEPGGVVAAAVWDAVDGMQMLDAF